MMNGFEKAIAGRRSFYKIGGESPVSDERIAEILKTAVTYVPSAFNSQTTRLVLLLGDEHKRLWEITKEVLRGQMPAAAFPKTEEKINTSFASGYGTVLFYEDTAIVAGLQERFPLYADNFPVWSQQTSGMHQFAVWSMLETAGFGASLQHYNPLIDQPVMKEWAIDPGWKLIAQMPFGNPLELPGVKVQASPVEDRVLIRK